MLVGLHIRNVVLVDRLELSFDSGLSVLTGETGAGKSILLDSLGLALGARADKTLLRPGADQASVSAFFAVQAQHPVLQLLADRDIELEKYEVIVRRTVSASGANRAYINDQLVSVALLKEVGRLLVEVQGQNDQQILMESVSHRELLDDFIDHGPRLTDLADSHARYHDALRQLKIFREKHQRVTAEKDYLSHVVEELATLAPEPGEEAILAESRMLLMNGERVAAALGDAGIHLTGEAGAEMALRAAQRALVQIPAELRANFEAAFSALDRAVIEAADAASEIESRRSMLDLDTQGLSKVEDRLFKLRDLARKHGVAVDQLAELHEELADKLSDIEDGNGRVNALEAEVEDLRREYREKAQAVSRSRGKAAKKFDKAVMAELAPLKLEKAQFETEIVEVGEDDWSAAGIDRVTFKVATIPGAEPAPLARIASGGELSRLLLSIKVVQTGADGPSTLVFDEVDRGLGGATADAVGVRLGLLAGHTQVLVVTHSPQVAARASHHWRVSKANAGPRSKEITTSVEYLDEEARREEVARMLAGAEVTNEARAAADSLIRGQRAGIALQ